MGLGDDKKKLFKTISAYTSLSNDAESPNLTNTFSSVNNGSDITAFLMDMLGVLGGVDAIKELTGKMFSGLLDDLEPKAKAALKKQLVQQNSGAIIPQKFVTDGVSLPLEKIDEFQMFKKPKTDQYGSLMFDDDIPALNNKIHDAIDSAGTEVEFEGVIKLTYLPDTESIRIKPIGVVSTLTIGRFLASFVDSLVLFNKKEIVSTVMDGIFGTITASSNKSVDEIKNELEINAILKNLIIDKENPTKLSADEMITINEVAINLFNGVNVLELGCGQMEEILDIETLTELVNTINESNDPHEISNAFDSVLSNVITSDSSISDENKETVRDNYFKKIINLFLLAITTAVTSTPQVRMIIGIYDAFSDINLNSNLGFIKDDVVNFKTFIKCNIKEIKKIIFEFIYKLAVVKLMKLLDPVVIKLIREKITQYKSSLSSLAVKIDGKLDGVKDKLDVIP